MKHSTIPPVVTSAVTKGVVTPHDDSYTESPIESRTTYHNYINGDVTIGWRSGLNISIPSLANLKIERKFVVRTEITIPTYHLNRVKHNLFGVDELSSLEMQLMKDCMVHHEEYNTNRHARLILEFTITEAQLKSYGGTVYLQELDLVISLENFDNVPYHPHSKAGMTARIKEGKYGTDNQQVASYVYLITIIDNNAEYGVRYKYIDGVVYRIEPRRDMTMRDGVYVTATDPNNLGVNQGEKIVTHYDFVDADKQAGLYRTKEEAINGNTDIAAVRKQEQQEAETRLMAAKMEFQETKLTHDREMETLTNNNRLMEMERDEARKNLESEQAKHEHVMRLQEHDMKITQLRTKDHYEAKSMVRKDSAEVLKILPNIIIGISALIVAFKAVRNN